jgi:flagellar protein FliS
MARDIYLESRVLTADPVELIHILYEHVLLKTGEASAAMAAGDVAARAKAISKILEALGELEGSLNHETGGPIAKNLANLYQYMRRRLMDASLKADRKALDEIASLIGTLDEGWTWMRQAAPLPDAAAYAAAAVESGANSWNA